MRDRLIAAAKSMGLQLDEAQIHKLLDYVALLDKWNGTYNLTAIRDQHEMLERHIIDSLSIARFIDEDEILDVGTGPGLPGIPLAIVFPERRFTLLDSNIKKTRFLTQAKISLHINNVTVAHERIEQFDSGKGYPLIVSRAFTSADNFAALCGPHLTEGGKLFAMKGSEAANESNLLQAPYRQSKFIQLDVPGCEAQRHLIIIENVSTHSQLN